MEDEDNRPVRVTGDERARPEVRKLSRAAIEIARRQLAQRAEDEAADRAKEAQAGEDQEVANG